MSPRLNLVVLYSADPEQAKSFYELLGLTFVREQHGRGPEHFAAQLEGNVVLDIYPLAPEQAASHARIGLAVERVDALVQSLADQGHRVVTPPQDSPWGRRAVVSDPDGRRVELSQRSARRCCD